MSYVVCKFNPYFIDRPTPTLVIKLLYVRMYIYVIHMPAWMLFIAIDSSFSVSEINSLLLKFLILYITASSRRHLFNTYECFLKIITRVYE